MSIRHCLCGAASHIKTSTRERSDGTTETLYWVSCPVCGQLGPKISAEGKSEEEAKAAAVSAWNEMLARARPLEA